MRVIASLYEISFEHRRHFLIFCWSSIVVCYTYVQYYCGDLNGQWGGEGLTVDGWFQFAILTVHGLILRSLKIKKFRALFSPIRSNQFFPFFFKSIENLIRKRCKVKWAIKALRKGCEWITLLETSLQPTPNLLNLSTLQQIGGFNSTLTNEK